MFSRFDYINVNHTSLFTNSHKFFPCMCFQLKMTSCASIKVFLNPIAKGLAKMLPITVCDGIINLRLIRVPVISIRYFGLVKDVLCNFVWFTKNTQRRLEKPLMLYARTPTR